MVTEVYGHIIDEERKNAQRIGGCVFITGKILIRR